MAGARCDDDIAARDEAVESLTDGPGVHAASLSQVAAETAGAMFAIHRAEHRGLAAVEADRLSATATVAATRPAGQAPWAWLSSFTGAPADEGGARDAAAGVLVQEDV